MIWTPEVVRTIEGMRATYRVNVDALQAGGDEYVKHLAGKLFQEIQDMAYTQAAELDIQDLFYQWDVEELPETDMKMHTLRAKWQPTTTEIILVGGPADGVRRVLPPDMLRRGPFRVTHTTAPQWRPEEDSQAEVLTSSVEYYWAGWHETERIWAYTVGGK